MNTPVETTSAETIALLTQSRLFKGFSPKILSAIAPLLTACRFETGNQICVKGDVSDCFYLISEGEVEISVSSYDGRIIVLGTLSKGDVFGEIGLLDHGPRTANATATTDVFLYRLNTKDFERLTNQFGMEEFKAITSYVCFLFRRAANSLEETAFMDSDIRIARKIRELYEQENSGKNGSFKISISQENLGKMVGLSREATNKSLSRLENKGLIKREYKNINVTDIEKFANVFEDEDHKTI